jgi:hypothetical protein
MQYNNDDDTPFPFKLPSSFNHFIIIDEKQKLLLDEL